jgi:hypothetical protein
MNNLTIGCQAYSFKSQSGFGSGKGHHKQIKFSGTVKYITPKVVGINNGLYTESFLIRDVKKD